MNGLKEEQNFENGCWLNCINDSGDVNDPYQLINEVLIDKEVHFLSIYFNFNLFFSFLNFKIIYLYQRMIQTHLKMGLIIFLKQIHLILEIIHLKVHQAMFINF